MKRLLLLLLMAIMMLPSVLQAQQMLTVANGTDMSEFLPIYGYYADVDQHTQMIYPANMFDNIQGAQISSITFYSPNSCFFAGFTVKIGETSASRFTSSSFMTDSVMTVYADTIILTNGEMTINFTTPYTYQGGNLLIDFSNDGNVFHSCSFVGASASGGGLLEYNYNYYVQNFLPQLTLTYTGGAPVTCRMPSDLTISDIDYQSATLTWRARGIETSWDIYETTSATDIPDASTMPTYSAFDTTFFLSALTPSTRYYYYVRANCGSDDVSGWTDKSFVTLQYPNQLPYIHDFEDVTENARWTTRNNGVNGWYIGSAVNATPEGQNALYISCNNGISNVYDNENTSTSWAYRDIDFGQFAAYRLSFKYRSNGQDDDYDYLRVYVGAPVEPTNSGASSGNGCTPVGAEELGVFSLQSTWQDADIVLNATHSGIQRLYFLWWNNGASGNNPPAAVDDIVITGFDCGTPVSLVFDNATADSYTFHFTPALATDNAWEAMLFSDTDTLTQTLSDTIYTFTNLSPNTAYYVMVRTDCGSEYSDWTSPVFGRTGCGNISIPFTEDFESFESYVEVPCWTVMSGNVKANPANAASGTKSLRFYGSENNINSVVALPELTTNITQVEMTFQTRPIDFFYSFCGTFQVGYVTDITDSNSFVTIETYAYSDFSDYEEKTVVFPNAPAGSRIAFRHQPLSLSWEWLVDDVDIHAIPSCPNPVSFSVTGTTSTSVSLFWVEAGSADTWNVAYGPAGFTIDANTDIEIVQNTPSVTIDNLPPGTAYDFYVQADCGGETSAWRGPVTAIPSSYNMAVSGIDTLTACTLSIFDDGGPNGNYSDNCDSYLILYPEEPGTFMSLAGTIQTDRYTDDYIIIYDGADTTNQIYKSNQLDEDEILNFGPFTSSTGPLMIYFHSDYFYNHSGFSIHTQCVTCEPPTVSFSNIGVDDVTVTWDDNDGAASGWQIAYGPQGFDLATATPEYVYGNNYYYLSNLTNNTIYDVYVRTDCGDDSYSMWSPVYSFRTLAGLPATTPYFCDFEDAAENGAWATTNGSENNQWYIGKPTGETDSVLYVSGDQGATAGFVNYMESTVWAYRDVDFTTGAEFTVSFNWKAYGGGGDYMKVFLGSPEDVAAGAENAPAGAVQLGGTMNYKNTWQHFETILGSGYANSTQRLYFMWHNDDAFGSSPAAVVDSIQITVTQCARPHNLTASNPTGTSFDVAFSPDMATDMAWEYVVCTVGDDPDNLIPVSITDTTFTATGLTASTQYDIYVRTVCGDNSYSNWSDVLHFATTCGIINALPYEDSFDTYGTGTTAYPLCWSKINTYSSERPYINTTYYSAPGSLYFYAGSGSYNIAITPEIDASIPVTTLKATFMFRGTFPADNLIVGVISNPLDANTFTPVDTVYPGNPVTTWVEREVFFNHYTGNGHYIAFKNVGILGYMDNLVIEAMPSCIKPNNVTATASTMNSVTLSWTEMASATQWDIEYGPSGFTQGTGTTVVAASNPFTVTGLNASTSYSFYVRANCGASDVSPWSDVLNATTECGVITLPYTENFDSYAGTPYNVAGVAPVCWVTTTTNTLYPAPHIIGSGEYCFTHSGTKSMIFTCGSNGADAYAVLPTFNQPLNTLHVNFWRQMESTSSGILTVGYVTSANNTSTFVTVATIPSVNNSSADTISVDFTGANIPATGNIAFHWYHPSSYYSCCIDDIHVTSSGVPVTECDVPLNVAASNVFETSATITWTPSGDETAWNLQYKAAADANWSSNINVNNTPSFTLIGLVPHIDYQVRVQAVCDANNLSDWTEGTFTTVNQEEPDCPAPTNVTAANITHNSAVITWSQEPNTASSWTVLYKQNAASSWEITTVNEMTYTLTGLNPDTQYDVQIMANCDNGMQSGASETIHFTTQPDGVNNYDLDNSISVYPNPTSGQFTIYNEQCTINSVDVYDVYGKLISTTKVEDTQVTLDINTYADGVYFARILTDKGVVTKRIVKK